jgi:4-hydroxybenzoate polyprenyltransferase
MGRDYATTGLAGVESTTARTTSALALLRAMRPYQWPKNAIVFAALAFSAGDAWRPSAPEDWWPLLWRSGVLFVLWCMAASAVYLVNDLCDREADRVHPRKRHRPIASGAVSPGAALTAAVVLVVLAVPPTFVLSITSGCILTGYVITMTAYSYELKKVAILDVLILCGGVVARAVSGATAIDVTISPWLYVCTSFGAFFLGSSKRWSEYRQLGQEAVSHRPSLARYNGELLQQLLTISAATALLSYALYTIESEHVPRNGAMALTIPFVGFALFRYLLLLNGDRRADAPDRILFTDPQILAAVAGFVVTAITVLLVF